MNITNLLTRISRDIIEIEGELSLPDNSERRKEILLNAKESLESAFSYLSELIK